MKTQRQFLSVAWLAAYALLLLSACRGPAPIAGGVTEITAAGVTSNTPLPASTPLPSGAVPTRAVVTGEQTPTSTVLVPPTRQSTPRPAVATATPAASVTNTPDNPTPPATDTPVPDDVKPGRPTETPAVLNITPPEISGYSLQQKPDGGWVYKDQEDNIVAHTVTYNWKGLSSKEMKPKGAIVVSNEKLMAALLKTANKGRGTTELPLFPLFINPEGLELREIKNTKDHIVIAVYGQIKQVVQPFPGVSPTLRNDFGSFEVIAFSPTNAGSLKFYAADFESPLKPFLQTVKPFLAPLAYNFSDDLLPENFEVPGASGLMTVGSSIGGKSLTLDNFLSLGNFTVVAG